ncbi:MAG: PQQ-binding-like beta-propeller repeat protein [Bacteroidota bacterium]
MIHLQRRLAFALGFLLCIHFSLPAQFRFAWLSDTHVGATTGETDLRTSVRDINAMSDIAFVILSGDITEMGSNEQLKTAKSILDSLNKPYHIIPGNHDTKWSESGATMFPRLWGNDRFVFDYSGYRFIGLHQGPLMRMADGHWAPEDVRWLDSVLTHLPQKSMPFFLVTHYPADDGIDNWYEVLDRVKRYNVQAFLVGHGHRNKKDNYEGVPGIMGRSNLRARDSVGGYTIAEVRTDTLFIFERTPGIRTRGPWQKIALGMNDYSTTPASSHRPDFSVNKEFPSVRTVWKFESGFTIGSTPALWKDIAIVGNTSGTVYALSVENGALRWKFHTGGPVYSSPDVSVGLVVFGSADSSVYCLNAGDGTLLWKFKTEAPVLGCPRISNGVVYIGGSDRKFRALNLKTGEPVWTFEGLEGFVETKPLVYSGKVFFGAWDSHFYALDCRNGKLIWSWKGDKPGNLLSPAACWPVASSGKVFVVAPDRMTTALDAGTGSQIWRTGSFQSRESIGLSEDGERVYVRTMNDSLVALSASSSTLQVVWTTNAHFGYDINSAALEEKQGTVFYGTKNGLLLAADSKTGEIRWKHRVGVCLLNTVAPLSAQRIIVSNFDGDVMLVAAD